MLRAMPGPRPPASCPRPCTRRTLSRGARRALQTLAAARAEDTPAQAVDAVIQCVGSGSGLNGLRALAPAALR
jgi:hypothetical protein